MLAALTTGTAAEGSRANARFLDIGFVPEADAQHPTLSPEKSSLNSCFSTGNSHSICKSCGRNLAEGLCSQRRKLLTPKRRARNTLTSFSRFAKENQVRPAKLGSPDSLATISVGSLARCFDPRELRLPAV
jgi:hypothetical protein